MAQQSIMGTNRKVTGALRALEQYMGKSVPVVSGYRSPAHNRAVKGAKQSQHLHRNAADISMAGWTTQEKKAAIGFLASQGVTSFITYDNPNSLHFDFRKWPGKNPNRIHFMFDRFGKNMKLARNWFKDMAAKLEGTSFPPAPDLSFPAAPAGPTQTEVGPGIHGAGLPAFVNAVPTARPVRAEPQDFSKASIGGLAKAYHDLGAGLATQGLRGVGGGVAPASAAPLASSYLGAGPTTPMVSGGTSPMGGIFGTGAVTPGMLGEPMREARPTQSVPTQARVSPPSGDISVASQVPGISMVDRATMASPPPESSLIGPQSRAALGPLGAVTPGMYGAVPATAATEQPAIPDDPRAAAALSMPQTGWNAPPPSAVKPAVAAPEEQTIAAPDVGAPVISPEQQTIEAPFPEAPTPEQINRTKLQGLLEHPLATLGNPFKGLGGIFGGVPTPEKSTYGTGLKAIGDILSGQVTTPGATSYSRSTPGFSVTALGNGVVAKTNQYGVTSYENVGFGPMKSQFGASSFGGWGGGKAGGSWSGSGGKGYGGSGNMSAGSGSLSHSTRY